MVGFPPIEPGLYVKPWRLFSEEGNHLSQCDHHENENRIHDDELEAPAAVPVEATSPTSLCAPKLPAPARRSKHL